MTVQELMDVLATFDPSAVVTVSTKGLRGIFPSRMNSARQG